MEQKELKIENAYLDASRQAIDSLINEFDKKVKTEHKKYDDMQDYMVTDRLDKDEKVYIRNRLGYIVDTADEYYDEITKLARARSMPFFGKFGVDDSVEQNYYYIGLKNIMNDEHFYVLDWRSAICSLYYDGNVGKTSYVSPMGKINVDLLLKRQFSYDDQKDKIESYVDTDKDVNDSVLQNILQNNQSATLMKNIVQSIRHEQDQVIRMPLRDNMMINGVAGSGKTSVGMHRIAYLLYNYKDRLNYENIVVVSPNKLFSRYISNLLPELGENNVTTISMTDLLQEKGLTFTDKISKATMVNDVVSGNTSRQKYIESKYHCDYLNMLNKYLSELDIKQYLSDMTLGKLDVTVDMLSKYLAREKSPSLFDRVYLTIMRIIRAYFKKVSEVDQERYAIIYTRKTLASVDLLKLYKSFIYKTYGIKLTALGYEDLPSLLYIANKVNGDIRMSEIQHVFIDEMQDYDSVSLQILRDRFPEASITIVGDFNQNLVYSSNNEEDIVSIFGISGKYDLKTSYRSTDEIMSLAHSVIGQESTQRVRSGDKPTIVGGGLSEIAKVVDSLPKGQTAIICKTENEARKVGNTLGDKVHIILGEDSEYEEDGKPIVTTIGFSKGLEFDQVVIPFANKDNYATDIDRQNLYIAITRALHRVVIVYDQDLTIFIKNI